MKRMSSLEYHFGVKVRFYPSNNQKKMIKQNYDAQRFVYNQYVGAGRLNYHVKKANRIKQLSSGLPFVMPGMSEYENQQALRMIDTQDLISKPKNIRDKYTNITTLPS